MKTITALGSIGANDAMGFASDAFAAIDNHANATVCNNDWYTDGDFDVVGYDEVGAPIVRPRGRGHAMTHGRPQTRHGLSTNNRGRQHGGGNFPGIPPGVHAPAWMNGAWGVNPPNEMLHVMPLVPQVNNGVFTAAIGTILFLSRPQKPFRGERIISAIANNGPSAATVIPVSTGILVGVDLQQVESGNIPISTWAATAFGVRLAMVDALPGIEISMPVTLAGGALLTTDTVTVSIVLLGRVLA